MNIKNSSEIPKGLQLLIDDRVLTNTPFKMHADKYGDKLLFDGIQ